MKIIFFVNLLYHLHIWFTTSFFPIYAKDLQINDTQIGLIFSVFSAISLIFMLPFGMITDKFGVKKVITLAGFLMLVWSLGLAFETKFIYFLLAYFIGGIGSVLFLVSLNTAFYFRVSNQMQAKESVYKITLFYTAATLGFALGPFLGSFVINELGYQTAFKIDSVAIILIIVLLQFDDWQTKLQFNIIEYIKDIKQKKMLILLLLTAFFYSHYGVEQTVYTLFMKKKVGLNDIEIGRIFLILGIWISFVTISTGKILKTRWLILFYAFGLFMCGAFQLLTGFADSFVILVIFRIAHTCGDAICTLMLGLIVNYVFEKKRLGFNFGFFLMSQLLASIPFSYISGVMINPTLNNYSSPFYLNGALIMSASIFILFFRKYLRKIFELDNFNK